MIAHIEALFTILLTSYLFIQLTVMSRAKNIISLSLETRRALFDKSTSDQEKERISQNAAIVMLKLFIVISFVSFLSIGSPFLILYFLEPITGYSIGVIYSLLSSPIYIASFILVSLFLHRLGSKK
jgi:hypothetical protein